MATLPQIHTSESNDSDSWLWAAVCAKSEAKSLFTMADNKCHTVDSIRELIAVPLHIENALRVYAREHRAEASGIEPVLRFRRRVEEGFERLVSVKADRGRKRLRATQRAERFAPGPDNARDRLQELAKLSHNEHFAMHTPSKDIVGRVNAPKA